MRKSPRATAYLLLNQPIVPAALLGLVGGLTHGALVGVILMHLSMLLGYSIKAVQLLRSIDRRLAAGGAQWSPLNVHLTSSEANRG